MEEESRNLVHYLLLYTCPLSENKPYHSLSALFSIHSHADSLNTEGCGTLIFLQNFFVRVMNSRSLCLILLLFSHCYTAHTFSHKHIDDPSLIFSHTDHRDTLKRALLRTIDTVCTHRRTHMPPPTRVI